VGGCAEKKKHLSIGKDLEKNRNLIFLEARDKKKKHRRKTTTEEYLKTGPKEKSRGRAPQGKLLWKG